MSIARIDLTNMQAIVDHWRGAAREDFNHPLLAALPPMLDAWAEDAKGVAELESDSAQVKALRARAAQLDAEHDRLLGDIHGYLTGLAGLHANGEAVLAVRDKLMPGGLRMKLQSFQAQGVAVQQAQAKLTDDMRAALARYAAPDVDLVAAIERWIAAGTELQQVDAERAGLQGQSTRLRQELRVRWLRLHKILEHGAAMSDLSEAARSRLFSKVREAG